MTSRPRGEGPGAHTPEQDNANGEGRDSGTRTALPAGPRRSVSGTALVVNRIVRVEGEPAPVCEANPAPRAAPTDDALSRTLRLFAPAANPGPALEPPRSPCPRVAPEVRITPAPITPIVGEPARRVSPPAEAPRSEPPAVLARTARSVSPPPAAPASAPAPEVRTALIVPPPARLMTQHPPLILNAPEPALDAASSGNESILAAPPSSLPQSLSALLVELLRCAVTEGGAEQQRLRRGLERAIELTRRTEVREPLVELPAPSLVPTPLPLAEPVPSRPQLDLSESMLSVINRAFSSHAGPDSRLDVDGLACALRLRNSYLAQRMLIAFDRNKDGVIDRADFLLGVRQLVFGTMRDKLRFAFQIHDLDGDDALDRSEVLQMIQLSLLEEQAEEACAAAAAHLTERLFLAADRDKDGRLSFDDFEALVAKHPELMKAMTETEARWIAPDAELVSRQKLGLWTRLTRALANRATTILLVSLWLALSVALFAEAALRYHRITGSGWVALARGAGAALNFNGALILLPVMRRMLTGLRRVPLVRALPLDDAVTFHRGLGLTLFGLSVVHSVAHLVNYAQRGALLAGLESGAGLSGALLLGVFIVMWWFSRSAIRKSGAFELFYITHLLYVPWLVLAFVHGPRFWMWAGVPLLAFLFEQLWRRLRTGQPAEICEAKALASGVTRLKIRPPRGFSHRAGDYLFLRLPALAPHEWHPFTISSAPERQNLTLHIRSLGNFTLALRQLVQARELRHDKSPLPAYIDGPYGTASGAIRESRFAVMIGAGIGVTPFTSVLESIVLRAQAGHTRPEKVHFYWLNRDAHSFEWFADLLFRIEALDDRRSVDINIYMTDGRNNATAMALNLARQVSHELGYPDLVTGLNAKTHMGDPDWRSELQRIKALHAPDPVHVYFCGPPGLARKIRAVCEALRMRFRQEQF